MPPVSVLCAPGTARLDDDREAELARRLDRLVDRVARPARARAGCRRRRAARAPAARSSQTSLEAASDGARRAPPRPAGRSRRGRAPSPAGRRSHSARSTAWPSARAADSGYSNAATPDGLEERGRGLPSAEMNAASTGLSAAGLARTPRTTASATSSAPATTGGTKSTITASMPGSASTMGEHRLVGRADGRAEHVDRVRDARLARQERGERVARLLGERRQLEAGAAQASAQRIPSPPAFVSSATRRPARQRLATRAAPRRRPAPRASRPGSRRPGGTAPRPRSSSRRARRCASRRRAGRPRPAALHREDRLLARDAPREPGELARVAERLEVEQDRSVSGSSSQYSSRSFEETSALLPIETNAESPSPRAAAARGRRGRARRSATRSRCCRRGSCAVRRSRSGPAAAEKMPRQFGPISRAPCARTSASSCSWRRIPSAPVSAKPAEITQSARVPSQRRLGLVEHRLAGDAEDGEVDGVGDVRDRRIGLHAGDRGGLRVDGVGDPVEVRVEDVAEELAADRAAPRRGADDGDRLRLEERRERAATATWSRSSTAARYASVGAIWEPHLDRAALEPRETAKPASAKTRSIGSVLRHHLGDERRRCRGGGRCGELLEQARADAVALERVGDGERDLGATPGRAGGRSSRARRRSPRRRRQGADQRAAVVPVGIEERLDRLGPERGKPWKRR